MGVFTLAETLTHTWAGVKKAGLEEGVGELG